jgi:hypothetical protein
MRNIAAIFGIAAVAAVVFSALPTAAFGFHLGPFYFHFPFGHHYHRHHLYARANPNEARAETNTEALESCTSLAPGVMTGKHLPVAALWKRQSSAVSTASAFALILFLAPLIGRSGAWPS